MSINAETTLNYLTTVRIIPNSSYYTIQRIMLNKDYGNEPSVGHIAVTADKLLHQNS